MEEDREEDNAELEAKLGYKPQKQVIYNKLLPYSDVLPNEIVDQLKEIKENLAKAVILRDIRPGAIHWVARLSRFVKLYGLCFSKDDHILLIKLMYQLAVTQNNEFWVTAKFAQMLAFLLKKKELISPSELELEWRPLYDLYDGLFHSSYNTIGMLMLPSSKGGAKKRTVGRKSSVHLNNPGSMNAEGVIKTMIRACRPYFPLSATAEILDCVRPMMCPFDMMMQRAMMYLELFLPTHLAPCHAHLGYQLWLDELLGIWRTCHNSSSWYWENHIVWLVGRLAWHIPGHVVWPPSHTDLLEPLVFTKLLRSFHLPVAYKKTQVSKADGLDLFAASMFVIANLGGGSGTQGSLERLFKALESYYHPSNYGYWSRGLHEFLNKLTLFFIRRLHRERYKKPSWEVEIAEHKKLTEEDITAFVNCVLPAAQLAMFSPLGAHDAGLVFHRLSLVRPQIVIPPLLDQLYGSLETSTEPHRLTACLESVVCVSRALVKGSPEYPEGPTHILPLLMQTLPGIDPNDIKKCMVTFQFIYTLVTLVPFIDCSSAVDQIDNLTEIEQQVCFQTAGFEDFVLQFMDRCFALIDNCQLEQITSQDREQEKMNREENMLEMGLSSTFSAILTQAHPKLYQAALRRLQSFITGRMIEIHVAGKFAANMCRSAVKINPEEALKVFLPGVCRLLMTLLENKDLQEAQHLDDEVLFNLLLLSELVRCPGAPLLPYIEQLKSVLQQTVRLKCREGYNLAGSVLRYLLKYLCHVVPQEYRSINTSWDRPLQDFLPIKHWGSAGDIHNLGLQWVQPGAAEAEALQSLVNTFLIPELRLLRKVAKGEESLTREELHQSLSIVLDVMLGSGGALPHWEEDPITLIDMLVKKDRQKFTVRSSPLVVTLDGGAEFPSNVRLAISEVILELVDTLLEQGSDDTKALCHAVNIFNGVMFFHGISKEDFDARWKSFQFIKDALANKLHRNKQHIRSLLIERTVLQHESRVLEGAVCDLTHTHRRIMENLLKLSTSQYSQVRSKAQGTLNSVFQYFPYSYKLVLPELVEYLKKDPIENHDQFKGALYLLLGYKNKSLMVRRDWTSLNMVWPTLLAAKHSEKPSIIRLLNALSNAVYFYMELFAIHHIITQGSVEAAKAVLGSQSPAVNDADVKEETITSACSRLHQKGQDNKDQYNLLVSNIVKLIDGGTLHWRSHGLALNLLGVLIRPDIAFPAQAVRSLMDSLIHDNISLRDTSVFYIPWILKQQKRKHKKVLIDPRRVDGNNSLTDEHQKIQPGDSRKDVLWMQYDGSRPIETEEEWEEQRFVEKTYYGWYTWAKQLEVYAPSSQQPPLDRAREDLTDGEKQVYDFFNNQEKVDKLVSFLSLEGNKDKDSFNTRRFWMFKGIFRNFGDTFIDKFRGHLERLVEESQKSSQRCATEIITGILRGSKHWTFTKHQALWSWLRPIIKTGMAKATVETVEDWGTCMATASADRDPNRLHPLLEILMQDPLDNTQAAFSASSRLYMLLGGLGQQEWRVAELSSSLLEYLRPQLAHSYKNIRDRVGSVLTGIFMYDIQLPGGSPSLYPKTTEFIDYLLPQLQLLIQETVSASPASISTSPGSMDASDLAPVLKKMLNNVHKGVVGGGSPLMVVDIPESPGSVVLDGHTDVDKADAYSKQETQPCMIRDTGAQPNVIPMEVLECGPRKQVGLSSSPVNSGFMSGGVSEERKTAVRLMNTVCRWLIGHMGRCYNGVTPELYRLLPHLCQLESVDNDPELRSNCVASLALMSHALVLPERLPVLLEAIYSIGNNSAWWRARAAILAVLQVVVFHNMFTVVACGQEAAEGIQRLVVSLLQDPRLEVSTMASQVLSGLIHCKFITAEGTLINEFTSQLQKKRKKSKRNRSGGPLESLTPQQVLELHGGVLGLCAYVSAFPYEVPDSLPGVLLTLSEHLNDPHPIPATIKKTLSNFRRTHHDNWRQHKQKFTDDQTAVLTDLLVSPSYYA